MAHGYDLDQLAQQQDFLPVDHYLRGFRVRELRLAYVSVAALIFLLLVSRTTALPAKAISRTCPQKAAPSITRLDE